MNRLTDELIYRTLIVAPLVILFAVTVFPFFFVLFISLFNVRSYNLHSGWEFVGLANYVEIFKDSQNISSIVNTILFMCYALVIETSIGMILAFLFLLVDHKFRMAMVALIMMPVLLSSSVVGMLWKQILSYDSGLLNSVLSYISTGQVAWLTPDPVFSGYVPFQQALNLTHGFLALLIVEVWQWSPIFVAMFLVVFSIIRKEIIHAAIVDGASLLNLFKDVYLPIAKPLFYGLILLRIMDMLKIYETIWFFFGDSSFFSNINIRLVTIGLGFRNYSYCAAFSVVIFFLIFAVLFLGRILLDRTGSLYYAE